LTARFGNRIREGKKSGSGIRINIQDHISESLVTVFRLKILKFFDADPDPGIGDLFDPGSGMENSDPGSGINIPDSQHRLAI
jgi:hypothetical protein